MEKKALIIGVSSQDGSYLADLLLEKGYTVIGTIRRSSGLNRKENIEHLLGKITLVAADLLDSESIIQAIKKYQPDEVYNLAAQSVPGDSWTHPFYTGEITALGVLRVLEAIKHFAPKAKMYQASTRHRFKIGAFFEMFCPSL